MAGRLASLAAVFSLALGTGCLSGPAPADHFYRLVMAPPAARVAPPLDGALHVDRLHTDAVTGERPLVYRDHDESTEVKQRAYERWSDPPSIMVQTALITYLQEAGAAPIVTEANARSEPGYLLTGRLERFELVLEPDPHVIVELDLTLTAKGGHVLVHRTYHEVRPSVDTSPKAAAAAFSEATGAVFARFLTDLPTS